MPSYTRGRLRDNIVFVPVNPILFYGWSSPDLAAATGITAADLTTQLGHVDAATAAAVASSILVLGANSPKPSRVVKRNPTATISAPASTSTFIAYDKLATALSNGWKLSKQGRGVSLTANVDGKRSITAIAELSNGLLYAFPLNKADFDVYGEFLGLTDSATITTANERNKLASGTSVKPGLAKIAVDDGFFSTFYSTASADNAQAAGFNIVSAEKNPLANIVAPPAGP